MAYPYKPIPLPYSFDALEPYIDARTMEIHYTKHYQGYINNLNKALEDYPNLQLKPLSDLLSQVAALPAPVQVAIQNQGGGTYNHALFWEIMKQHGGGEPKGLVAEQIKQTFNTFENFKKEFNLIAKKVFGSGWAWLSVNQDGTIHLGSTPNQNCPLSDGRTPIMGLDVWEHAYYLKYQNRRPDYIEAWWHVIDWDRIEENYRAAVGR